MPYSEGDDSDSNCESFSVGDDERSDAESSDSGTDETPSRTEMGALLGLLCRTAHGVVLRATGYQKYVLSRFCVSTASFDADNVCTDRMEAESRQK